MLNFRDELRKIKEEKFNVENYQIVEECLEAVLAVLKEQNMLQFYAEQTFYFGNDGEKPILYIEKENDIIFQKELENMEKVEIILTILKGEFSSQGYKIQGQYRHKSFFVAIRP